MNGLPYYKAYPRDFIEGTIGWGFELKGAYRLVLDLIYMQAGKLPDDAGYICGLLGCTKHKWASLRKQLLDSGKIELLDGFLVNSRAFRELKLLESYANQQRENASKAKKNNKLKKPRLSHTEPEPESDIFSSENIPPSPHLEKVALELYNAMAERTGLPKAQRLNDARKGKLRARLKEAGGIDGWKVAMGEVEASTFLTGANDRGWRASLDFVLQESSFTRIMEGAYRRGQTARQRDMEFLANFGASEE